MRRKPEAQLSSNDRVSADKKVMQPYRWLAGVSYMWQLS